ncbi:BNR/Asp-box repeat protein [Rosistilla oblonga]|uniref:sialidase family protein n=1 Tax=Rosistilla oblonga TaxID=2527990 RepID=UPI00118A2DCC|nr:sialidase family protein [Rosistilla oblonga]QDV13822.1 BNR/Asp-box repeat protein [Rosistilla oblonga]
MKVVAFPLAVLLAFAATASRVGADDPLTAVTLETIDLTDQLRRQVVVDRETGLYLGYPTTALLDDGQSMLCIYAKGRGRGALLYKRSEDGGKTWGPRLDTPENWSTSKGVPNLHRVIDAEGKRRNLLWAGMYPARTAVSEDEGKQWSELKPAGDWGGSMVMGCVEALNTKGHYLAMFHDDGRYFTERGGSTETVTVYKSLSTDGGLTWSRPEAVFRSDEIHLAEPACIRSPDGKRLAVLLQESRLRKNSHVMFSDDEGKTWTQPRELPLALTGERHVARYDSDGRLMVSFRCRSPYRSANTRPFEGSWVAWVGTWDDIANGKQGQYNVRLKENTKGYDTGYSGVELLGDGTFVATSYGHWDEGLDPYILSVRLKLAELDGMSKGLAASE